MAEKSKVMIEFEISIDDWQSKDEMIEFYKENYGLLIESLDFVAYAKFSIDGIILNDKNHD